ncbi:MAG: DegQ family serine endoprotease, partial [Candidatus Brocadiales bacterium]
LMLGLAGMQPNISTAIAAVNEDKQARLEKELEELQSEAVNLEKAFELVSEFVKPVVVSIRSVKIFKHPETPFRHRRDRERGHGRGPGPGHGQKKERDKDQFREFFGDEFFDRFFKFRQPPPEREFKTESLGSGVIVDEKGYILTNNHVIKGAEELKIRLVDKREFNATVIGTDPQSDIAVIKIESDDHLPVAKLGDSDKIKVGQWAIAIGNPFGLVHTVSAGIISATGRANVGVAQYEDLIQTDAAINPGNSGGPLVNIRGEVIGINTAIFTRTGGYQGIGFAIPINMAKSIMRDLIETGKVTRGWLGVVIQDIDPSLAESFGVSITEGVLISDVQPDSPASAGGMERGDIVIEYNGVMVRDVNHLRNIVASTRVGSVVTVKVLRNGNERDLSIKIDAQPAELFGLGPRPVIKNLGITVQSLNSELAKSLGYEGEKGVVVSSVDSGSSGALADLKEGDLIKEVNREKISSVDDFRKAVAKSGTDKDVLMLVRRGEYTRYVIIKAKH